MSQNNSECLFTGVQLSTLPIFLFTKLLWFTEGLEAVPEVYRFVVLMLHVLHTLMLNRLCEVRGDTHTWYMMQLSVTYPLLC